MYHGKELYASSTAHCKGLYARVLYARSTQGIVCAVDGARRGRRAFNPLNARSAFNARIRRTARSTALGYLQRVGGQVVVADSSSPGNLERLSSSVGVEQLDTCPEVLSSWDTLSPRLPANDDSGHHTKMSTHFRTAAVPVIAAVPELRHRHCRWQWRILLS